MVTSVCKRSHILDRLVRFAPAQTSLKMLYWSMLIYEYEEVRCVHWNISAITQSERLLVHPMCSNEHGEAVFHVSC